MTDRTYTIALAGNPNVGKSTLFNALTHLHQHTGNWPGKTVATARGCFTYRGEKYTLVDLPGTYSLLADSPEEEIARDFLQSGQADVTLVVADATCLERNLHLVLQVMERAYPVVLCVNLMDEAGKRGIALDLTALQDALGIPVVGTAVRGGEGLTALRETLWQAARQPLPPPRPQVVRPDLTGLSPEQREDALTGALAARARELAALSVRVPPRADRRDRRLDRLLTSRATGIPVMLLLLGLVFWLTIAGANVPSALLSDALLGLQEPLRDLLAFLPQVTDQPLLGALYGGVLQGVAIGLFVKYAVSSGGTELLGRVLRPLLPGLTIPQVIALLDGAVVLAGAVVLHNPENVLYALIVILVSSRVSDMVITGFAKSKLCYIITDRPEEVADLLLQNSPRGVTNLNGTGMYARAPKGVLMTCVKARQLGQLKQLVSAVDPDAFVIVSETTEVLGKGFKQIDEE